MLELYACFTSTVGYVIKSLWTYMISFLLHLRNLNVTLYVLIVYQNLIIQEAIKKTC